MSSDLKHIAYEETLNRYVVVARLQNDETYTGRHFNMRSGEAIATLYNYHDSGNEELHIFLEMEGTMFGRPVAAAQTYSEEHQRYSFKVESRVQQFSLQAACNGVEGGRRGGRCSQFQGRRQRTAVVVEDAAITDRYTTGTELEISGQTAYPDEGAHHLRAFVSNKNNERKVIAMIMNQNYSLANLLGANARGPPPMADMLCTSTRPCSMTTIVSSVDSLDSVPAAVSQPYPAGAPFDDGRNLVVTTQLPEDCAANYACHFLSKLAGHG